MIWNDLRFRALCSKHSTKHVSQVIRNFNTKNNLGVKMKTSPYIMCEALYTVKKKFTIFGRVWFTVFRNKINWNEL